MSEEKKVIHEVKLGDLVILILYRRQMAMSYEVRTEEELAHAKWRI